MEIVYIIFLKELDNVQRDQKQAVVTKNAIEVRYVLLDLQVRKHANCPLSRLVQMIKLLNVN